MVSYILTNITLEWLRKHSCSMCSKFYPLRCHRYRSIRVKVQGVLSRSTYYKKKAKVYDSKRTDCFSLPNSTLALGQGHKGGPLLLFLAILSPSLKTKFSQKGFPTSIPQEFEASEGFPQLDGLNLLSKDAISRGKLYVHFMPLSY